MKRRKWNVLLIAFSVIGGLLGWIAGEWLLARYEGRLHETVIIGLYFGILALFIVGGCLLAETISPRLNGAGWRLRYGSDGWKWLAPSTLLLLFAAGALLQWLYALEFGGRAAPKDYVLLIDGSESMRQNDPAKQSRAAATTLVAHMKADQGIAVGLFNERTTWLQPLTATTDEALKASIGAQIASAPEPKGLTNISEALSQGLAQLKTAGTPQGRGVVILISDGYSETNVPQATAPYVAQGFKIYTVGLESAKNAEGTKLLKRLSEATGGTYRQVELAGEIPDAVSEIYTSQRLGHLVGERTGVAAASDWRGALRVVWVGLLGGLMGLALGIVFDNRFLAKGFIIGGAISGLLAGLVLEGGFPAMFPGFIRFEADLLLALLLALSSGLFAVEENNDAARRPLRASIGYGRLEGKQGGQAGPGTDRSHRRFR